MTTNVIVQAHVNQGKAIIVQTKSPTKNELFALQDGATVTVYAYEDQEIIIKEVDKATWDRGQISTPDDVIKELFGGGGYVGVPINNEIVHHPDCCASRGCHQVCSHLCGTELAIPFPS